MIDVLIFMSVGLIVIKMSLVYFHTMKFLETMYSRSNWKELKKIHKPVDGGTFYGNVFHPFRWTYSQMFDEI